MYWKTNFALAVTYGMMTIFTMVFAVEQANSMRKHSKQYVV